MNQVTVRGEGSHESKIWIIGEAPGAQEEKTGKPFVGGSGQILDGILRECGIQRAETFIDNVVQQRPSNNDFSVYYKDAKKLYPSEALINAHQRLRELIRKHHPNIIIALGNEALYALTGKKGILKWRGSLLECEGCKVIASVHPALIIRQYEYRPQALFDFQKAKAESISPNFPPSYTDHFTLNPPYDTVIEMLKSLHQKEYVSFDIETQDNQITCIGFGWSVCDALCIPIYNGNYSYWTLEQELAIIREMKLVFEDTKIKTIAQNAQFDMTYIKDLWGIEVKNLWMDTMIAHHCVYSELPKSLAFQASIYTNRPYYKEMFHGKGDSLWIYNCLDCVSTWEAAIAIKKEAEEFRTWNFYLNNSHKLIMPLWKMQMRGVKIDMDKRAELKQNFEKEVQQLEAELHKEVGYALNVASPKQMKEFLYEKLKLPQRISRTTGNLTADQSTLEEFARKFQKPVLNKVIEIRKINKLLSTYINAQVDKDGRIRCSYVITGTETGRLSSRESIYGSGTNLQNIPRNEKIRSLFIPDTGYKLINADLSQAEARVVAFLAGEKRLQAVFEEGGDIHKRNASMVFHKSVADITDGERQLAKTLVHAANYGIGKRKFAKLVGIAESEAIKLLNQYYATYPGIKNWHREVEETLRKKRILDTPMGRRRIFFGRFDQDLVRAAVAFIPQSTVSDVINQGLIKAWNALPQEWEILMQVHDSLLFQVPEYTHPIHVYKFIHHYLEFPIDINYQQLIIPVDIKWGSSWGNLEKLEI